MPAPAWENPADFLDVENGFATTAIFTGARGTVEVKGIFDDAVMNAQTGEYEMGAGIPRFTCPAAEVGIVRRHDVCNVDGRTFAVMADPRPDGTGWAVIEMAEEFH